MKIVIWIYEWGNRGKIHIFKLNSWLWKLNWSIIFSMVFIIVCYLHTCDFSYNSRSISKLVFLGCRTRGRDNEVMILRRNAESWKYCQLKSKQRLHPHITRKIFSQNTQGWDVWQIYHKTKTDTENVTLTYIFILWFLYSMQYP